MASKPEIKCPRCCGAGQHPLVNGLYERPHPPGSWTVCSKCKGTGFVRG